MNKNIKRKLSHKIFFYKRNLIKFKVLIIENSISQQFQTIISIFERGFFIEKALPCERG